MTTNLKTKFDLGLILASLPVNYSLIDAIQSNNVQISRNALFTSYNSGLSKCFVPYKPISRILKDEDETGI